MSAENNNNYQKLVNWGHGLSIFFASFGVISVTIIVFFLLSKTPDRTQTDNVFKIEYTLQIDPIQLKRLKGQDAIEYLKFIEQNNLRIAEQFDKKINDQYGRVQKLIELKEEQNLYNTYGAGVIAIILAIGSFFGFKSINQMHKDTIETAEIEAKKVAETEAKKVAETEAKKVAKEKAKQFISEKLTEIQEDIINRIKSEHNEAFESIRRDVSDLNSRTFALEANNMGNPDVGSQDLRLDDDEPPAPGGGISLYDEDDL